MNAMRRGFGDWRRPQHPAGPMDPPGMALGCAVAACWRRRDRAQEEPTRQTSTSSTARSGSSPKKGMPYWIWQVLPRMFPEKLPGPADTDRSG